MRSYAFLLSIGLLMLGGSVSFAHAQGMRMTSEQRAQRLKDSLALNDAQTAKVVGIYQQMDKRREEVFASAPDDRDARMQLMRTLMDSTDVKIEALLTPAQKEKYQELKKQRAARAQSYQMRPQNK